MQNETVIIKDLSNQEFLERYAHPGRVGLSGGNLLPDIVINRAQRHLDAKKTWGTWSHVFLFQGTRVDGHQWLIESDLQFHKKHIQLGVQENRIAKYFDEKAYSTLAVLDFGLSEAKATQLVREGLELVAAREQYSLRELVGTLIALKNPALRGKANLLAQKRSMFCSAFVQHIFRRAGLDLTPGVDHKHTAPEDISRTTLPHTTYLLQRNAAPSKMDELKTRVQASLRKIKGRSS